ncbi:MAG TPA: TonB-dependent receptor [Thermoanaerobaculia bacterium]|nr:TonB-dependent receptor [Thermoanaerobaculia bacterium]
MPRPQCVRLLGLVAVFVFLLGALPGYAQSQATTGVIEGTVTDEGGGVLPGATVTLRNTATNFDKVVITGSDGTFRALLLPLGPYRITVELTGFAKLVREGIDLGVGQTINLKLPLQVAAAGEITVTGEAPVVETNRVEGAVRIDEKSVENLPNNGRNFLDYTKLTPGVTTVQGPDGDELSINGQKGIHNNVSVDGADFNNPFFGEQRGGQRPAFTFNLDAVKEVVVVADGANAEFGRSSGGFVNVVTKSGTNQIQGSAHAFFKNQDLTSRAEKPDGGLAPKFDENQAQAGFTLGGPLTKDKTFYFISADYQRGRSTKQTDPARIDPRVVDYFASIGDPGENLPIDRTNDARVFLGKIDWQASEKNLFTLRYTYTWAEQANGTFDVDSWGRSANAIEKDKSNAGTGTIISTISENLLNEARFQYAREDRPRPYDGPIIGGRPLPDTAFDFANSFRFGMPFFIPVKYYDERYQVNENLSVLHNDHAIKGGVEYNQVSSNQTFIGFANGRFIFSSTDGFLNYAKNPKYVECSDGSSSQVGVCPPGTSVTGPVLLYLQQAGANGNTVEQAGTQKIPQKEPAAFLQDSWQPKANVTVQYGLRYEAEIEPDPLTPPSKVFFSQFIGKTVNTAAGPQHFPSDGKIPSDYNMWQPRLGITWDPKGDGKGVVRATAGIFYARIPGLALASTRSTNGTLGQSLFRSSALAGILGPVPAYPNLIPQSAVGSPFDPDVFVFDKNFQNPRTTAASLSYEKEVTNGLALLVKGNYAKGDHLTRFVNRNDPLLGSPWSTGLGPGGTNGIGTLTTVESKARSNYWGVTLGANKRWTGTLQYQVYYTYSKDKSDDDNERDPFTFRYAKITDLGPEYGYSDRDQRHRVNAFLLWQAPHALDVSLRYAYRSAQPQSITATGAVAQTPQDRINPDGSVTQRNLGRKDNQFNSLDFRLSRDFHAGSLTIQPSLDVFNVFNSSNFRRPEVTNLIFNFDGTVQSGNGDPRQAQIGVRILF